MTSLAILALLIIFGLLVANNWRQTAVVDELLTHNYSAKILVKDQPIRIAVDTQTHEWTVVAKDQRGQTQVIIVTGPREMDNNHDTVITAVLSNLLIGYKLRLVSHTMHCARRWKISYAVEYTLRGFDQNGEPILSITSWCNDIHRPMLSL